MDACQQVRVSISKGKLADLLNVFLFRFAGLLFHNSFMRSFKSNEK